MKRLMTWLVVLAMALPAFAELTPAQNATVKATIQADTELAQYASEGRYPLIALALNAAASPAYIVWRTAYPASEYRDAIVWTEFTARSAGERDMWSLLTDNGSLPLDCSRPNVRQAVVDAFSGAGGAQTRSALNSGCKRQASRVEALLAVGPGTLATPSSLTFEGAITPFEVEVALR